MKINNTCGMFEPGCKAKVPSPFTSIAAAGLRKIIVSSLNVQSINIPTALMKALTVYIWYNQKEDTKKWCYHGKYFVFADVQDKVVVEYKDDINYSTSSGVPNPIQVAMIDKNTNHIFGKLYYESERKTRSYNMYPCGSEDSTALWLAALLYTKNTNALLQHRIDNICKMLEDDINIVDVWSSEELHYLVEDVMKTMRSLEEPEGDVVSWNRLTAEGGRATPIQWKAPTLYDNEQAAQADQLSPLSKNGVPFNAAIIKASVAPYKEVVIDLSTLPRSQSYADYSPEQKARVPEISPKYIEGNIDRRIKSEIARTWATGRSNADRLTNFMIVGPMGTGKSKLVEHMAALLKMPHYVFTCSRGTTEDNLLLQILPEIGNAAGILKAGLSSAERKAYEFIEGIKNLSSNDIDALAMIFGLPSIAECFFDPEMAIEAIPGGDSIIEKTHTKACELRDAALFSSLRALSEKLPKGSGVSYRVVETPVVKAIREGGILELQEVTNVADPAVFSVLYDVLEKESTGKLQTQNGEIIRHPDFIFFATANTEYHGNKPLPGPFNRRCKYIDVMDDLSSRELKIRTLSRLGENAKGQTKIVENAVQVYLVAREKAQMLIGDPNMDVSPDQLKDFADAVIGGADKKAAFNTYILNHLSYDHDDRVDITAAVEDLPLFIG